MSCNKPYFALAVSSLVGLTLVFLFYVQFFALAAGAQPASGPMALAADEDPIAVIKNILVNGAEKAEATVAEVRVTRASGRDDSGQAALQLFVGDEVFTGPNAQVTVLFLDDAAEKDNEVLIDSNARIRIGSVFDWFGRILIRCKGAFDTRTEKVRLGVQGTEYELIVERNGTNKVTVLEGAVTVEGNVTAGLSAKEAAEVSASLQQSGRLPPWLKSSFAPPRGIQRRIELAAVSGQTSNIENTFTFTNNCRQQHQYEIHGPRGLEWFHILGADRFEIGPGQTRSITFAIRLDGNNVQPGAYDGEIIASCIDCGSDQTCNLAGLLLPVRVNVLSSRSGPGPGPGPRTSQQKVSAQKLQQVTIDQSNRLSKTTAAEDAVRQAVNWTNPVILSVQPGFSAQSLIPHFESWTRRDEVFREARLNAILRDDPRSYEILGAVYLDWGNGAKAIDSYERMRAQPRQLTPDVLTNVGEAYRLTGKLAEAEQVLKRVTSLKPDSAPALNALGNVYLDQARAAQDKRNFDLARGYLERAENNYTAAFKAQPTVSDSKVKTVTQSNLGEVYLRQGDNAREQGHNEEALANYPLAERAFRNALGTDAQYPFAVTGLGAVYRGAGETALAQGDRARAGQFFTRSQDHYRQAISQHDDMAEAYLGLGKVLEDLGNKAAATRNYVIASQVRPDLADSYYYLARNLAESNPVLASAYAKTFLKLEPVSLQGGDKSTLAQQIVQGSYRGPFPTPTPSPYATVTPVRTPPPTPSPYPTATPVRTPTPTPTGPLVKVPGLKGDKPESALAELRKKGMEGQLKDQPDCEASGRVLFTEPAKDERVPSGTMVTVYVSTAGENAVRVAKITGLRVSDAERELRGAGLSIKIARKEETDTVAPNTVVKQKPDAYTPLKAGCPVEVTVAVAIPRVEMPNFIGRSIDEAFASLPRFLGTLVRGNVVEVDRDGPPGTVIDQNPKPGEMVRRGTAVDLVIIRSEALVAVPPLVRRSLYDAAEILKGLGLGYQVVQGDTGDSVIIRQDPGPGTRVRRGTRIRLWFPVRRAPGIMSRPPG